MNASVRSEATVSEDGLYRYTLTRRWGDGPLAMWIMLNPSTADASQDDPTIRRCMGFARTWGFDGIGVVNLFALRAANPAVLTRHPRPTGYGNDRFIEVAGDQTLRSGGVVVAAWGAHPMAVERGRYVLRHLLHGPVHSLGTTRSGAPRHPLYVRGDTILRDAFAGTPR